MNDNIYDDIETEEHSGIDIRKYLYKIVKYWYLFVISLLLAYFVAYWNNKFSIPVYGLHTTMLITKNSGEEAYAGGLMLLDRSKDLSTEIGIMKSFSISRKAIEELDFNISYYKDERFRSNYEVYTNSPFIVEFDSLSPQYNGMPVYVIFQDSVNINIKIDDLEVDENVKIGDTCKYEKFKFVIKRRDSIHFNQNIIGEKYFFEKNNMNSLARSYKNKLEIEVSPERSNILWIWLTGTNRQKDADYLNKIVEIFIRQGLEEKNQKIVDIIEFIDQQLLGVSDSLQQSEGSLQYFKEESQMLDLKSEGQLLKARLNETQSKILTQRYKLGYYKSLINQVESNNEAISLTSPSVLGVDDPILLSYIKNLGEVLTNQDVLEFSVKGDMPNARELKLRVKNARKQIITHAQSSIEITTEILNNLKKDLAKIESEIKKLPASERKIVNIERKFNINDEIYTMLFTRRIEASITQKSNKPDAKALDKAMPFNAVKQSPDTGGNQKKALMIGFILPILFIVAKEFFNNKIEDKADIERKTHIPVLGTIGNNHKDSNLPVLDYPKSPIAESFRAIRTNLQYILRKPEQKVIVITSSVSGEGKSFISTNFASVLAISQKKTLLIGLDLRKPKLQAEFDYPEDRGLSSYLIDYHTFDEVIKPTRHDNLFIALSGPVPPNPAELIESDKMIEFLNKAKEQFDYIIIDTPPVGVVTDALLLTEQADSYIYVVRQNYSHKNVLKLIDEVAKTTAVKNINIVLNDAKMTGGYGYGYGYGYDYGYGQGYYDEDHLHKKHNTVKDRFKKLFKNT